jgi:HD-GYP domain-containing protein (c-di-GMP phosphodiesterase class II)
MKTVLLAYGRDQDGAAVETLLAARGHRVLRSRSGTEALETVRREQPEVLVADVMLPRLDGFALCRRIKEDDLLRHLPVLLHSFRVEGPKYEAFAAEVGAERFLPNGVPLEELARLVDEAQASAPDPAEDLVAANRRLVDANLELEQSRREALEAATALEQRNRELTEAVGQARADAERVTRERTERAALDREDLERLQTRIRELEVAQQRLLETEQRALGMARETRVEASRVAALENRLAELQATRSAVIAARADAERLFAELPAPAWLVDVESGKVVALSEAAAHLTGTSSSDALHAPFRNLVPSLTLGGEAPWPRRFAVPRTEGESLPMEAERAAVSHGGRACWLLCARDTTAEQASLDALGAFEGMERAMLGLAAALSTLSEMQDAGRTGRLRRVGELAAALGSALGLPARTLAGLRVTGQLLDVGMLLVPRELLWRASALSPAEFELVKTHAERGYELLREIPFPWPVAEAVRQHHERLDGSGYPRGLAGDAILLEARIVAVADVVDAMLSPRPHRPPLRLEACLAELQQQAGRRYDESVVAACVRILQEREGRIAIASSEAQRVA